MKNRNSTALEKSAAATAEKRGRVRLQPMNEGQEINIVEHFEGSAAEIITRCLAIIRTLAGLFPESVFTVKIEPFDLSDCFYVDESRIFDSHFNEVAPISHLNRHFNPKHVARVRE